MERSICDNSAVKTNLYHIFDELGLVEIDSLNNVHLHSEEIDSIQLISIIVEIEECFGIEIPDEYMVPEFVESFDSVLLVVLDLLKNKEMSKLT